MAVLTKTEMVQLTGSKHTSKQRHVLERSGIIYIERWDGSIVTTWEHVNNPKAQTATNNNEPNFDEIA